jgi:hypothetical protein
VVLELGLLEQRVLAAEHPLHLKKVEAAMVKRVTMEQLEIVGLLIQAVVVAQAVGFFLVVMLAMAATAALES